MISWNALYIIIIMIIINIITTEGLTLCCLLQVDTYLADYMSKCAAAASQGASAYAAAGLVTAGSQGEEGASGSAVGGLATAGSDASVYALVGQPSAGINNLGEDAAAQVRMSPFSPFTCTMQCNCFTQLR